VHPKHRQEFFDLAAGILRHIEPLRAMRMLYYLAWSARQRNDRRFKTEHPHWVGSAFLSREIEDLCEQLQYCMASE
jgi:Ser/Thr protein kinase RdoA (MazF antagonist)